MLEHLTRARNRKTNFYNRKWLKHEIILVFFLALCQTNGGGNEPLGGAVNINSLSRRARWIYRQLCLRHQKVTCTLSGQDLETFRHSSWIKVNHVASTGWAKHLHIRSQTFLKVFDDLKTRLSKRQNSELEKFLNNRTQGEQVLQFHWQPWGAVLCREVKHYYWIWVKIRPEQLSSMLAVKDFTFYMGQKQTELSFHLKPVPKLQVIKGL